MQILKGFHWLIYPLFILACARQTAPTGGPKDTIPPALISSTPTHGQTNFRSDKIEMSFSEAVAIANPKEQIVITPDIEKKYKITARRNKVVLQLETPLLDSTTYSFSFRESIQDITEKNPVRNLKIALSTGDYIDSLAITGNVHDMLEDKPIKEATVAVYQQDTFSIFRHKPAYITKADDKGIFRLENLAHGRYYIYAFDDKNKNLIVDSRNEPYGFLGDPIDLSANTNVGKIGLVRLDARPLKITSARPSNTYFNIRFSKGIRDYTLTPTADTVFSSLSTDRQNILIYNAAQIQDSVQVNLKAIDSLNQTVDTTLYVKFTTRETKPEKFEISVSEPRLYAEKGLLTATITFSKPIMEINTDSTIFRLDSANIIQLQRADLTVNQKFRTLYLNKKVDRRLFEQPGPTPQNQLTKAPRQTGPQNLLRLGKGALISAEGDSSTTVSQQVKLIRLEDTGIIFVNINTTQPNFLVQIVTRDGKVLQTKRNSRKVAFEDLEPGEYRVRAIADTNADGSWSPGNYNTRTEPERVYYYINEKRNPTIQLKANFELGPMLIMF